MLPNNDSLPNLSCMILLFNFYKQLVFDQYIVLFINLFNSFNKLIKACKKRLNMSVKSNMYKLKT